jgi:hypothetical protein
VNGFAVTIKGAFQLPYVFFPGWTMARRVCAESFFAWACDAFRFDGDISQPFGDAQEGLLHAK